MFGFKDEAEIMKHKIFMRSMTNKEVINVFMLLQSNKTFDEIEKMFEKQKEQE